MELRDYQQAALTAAFRFMGEGRGHPLLVLPTGAGKSALMGACVAEARRRGGPSIRALVLAHRKELLRQNGQAVARFVDPRDIGFYSASLKAKDTQRAVIVAGIQSLARRPHACGAFDLVLLDEAHLVPPGDSGMYRTVIEALQLQRPNVMFVGLTATPYRLGHGLLHEGDGALFHGIAYEADVADLIARGYLCPLTTKATTTQLDVTGVGTRQGEFVAGALAAAVDRDDITEAVADECVRRLADRRKWIAFAAGVSHAEHLAAALAARGITAAAVHGDLADDVRDGRLAAFRRGDLRCLTSVDVLSTGYDEPAIDAIVLVRPTKSPGLYTQQVGRGLRRHPDKADTLVLDFAGNIQRHGPIDLIRAPRAKGAGGREGAAPVRTCPACDSVVPLATPTCPDCGCVFPPPDRLRDVAPEPTEAPILARAAATGAVVVGAVALPAAPTVTWHEVTDVAYALHEGRRADDGTKKPDTLKVTYYDGFRTIAQEWVCLAHDGFARRKAERWWVRRCELPPPSSIVEALALCAAGHCDPPTHIATQPDGKYVRVVDARFAVDAPAGDPATPRACATCDHWVPMGDRCLKWQTTPPAPVIAAGCEDWQQDNPLPF